MDEFVKFADRAAGVEVVVHCVEESLAMPATSNEKGGTLESKSCRRIER